MPTPKLTLLALLSLGLFQASAARGATVLLVTRNTGSLTSEESLRKAQVESWGHTVTTVGSAEPQSTYDTALSSADVAWVTEEVLSGSVSYKLRETTVGVVCGEIALDLEMGFSTSDGYEEASTDQVLVTSNDHFVTHDLPTGLIAIFSSVQPRSIANPTTASGLTVLATRASGDPTLAVMEPGAALANTYNGNSTASGRRVRLPWGGTALDWSSLNNDALAILHNALRWAAGEADLETRWKLDETSGTTAADSGGGALDGVFTNGVQLAQGGPYPGAEAPRFDGSDDHVDLPDLHADFSNGLTIAAWVNPSSAPSGSSIRTFVNLSNGTNVDEIWFGWVGTSGMQLYLSDTTDGSSVRTIEDNSGFTLGRWVHCVATVDASGNATLYRNGQVTKSGFYTSLPTSVQRTETQIATSPLGDHYNGGLNNVRVYNRALTQREVAELYGLVGHWDFDEGTGSTAADSTGAASDAQFLTGTPLWIDGVRGAALEFDGTNDAQTADTITPPDVGAVAMWFRSDGTPASRQRPWGIGADFEMWQDTDGLVSMDLSTDGFQGGFITTDPLDTAGVWYHVVAQYNSDDESYEIYLNGQLHKSGVSTWDITQQPANYLTFGTRTGSTERFSGVLDDFRLYNRWLSTEEIAEIYGLVGWWRMEETSGSLVSDSSGAGNHGTINGTASWSSDAKEGAGSIDLDGTNHVEVPSLILTEGSATVAGWARLTDNDTNGSELITLGNHFGIRIDSTLSGQGSYGYAYNGSYWDDVKPNHYHEGTGWHHFVMVADDVNLERRFYIDGVLEETLPASGPLVMSGQNSSTLIGTRGTSLYDFTGQIDDVRVYNRAIDPTEIEVLYSGGQVSGPRIVRWLEVANP